MALIDTVPTTRVTVPTFLVGKPNGKLDPAWLRSLPGESTRQDFKMFVPVSYAMQALHLASKGIIDRTTGRYRSYDQQVNLFLSRYVKWNTGNSSKVWNGVRYWKRDGVAMAATPGTSNHGLGLADDLAEENDDDTAADYMSDAQLTWMRDNAPSFGFGLEVRSERWHWHWIGLNRLSQRVVDVLDAAGVKIPSMAEFGFTVPRPSSSTPTPPPTPTPPGDEEMVDGDDIRNVWIAPPPGDVGQGSANLVWLNAVIAKVGSVADVQRRNGLKVTGIYDTAAQGAYNRELAAMKSAAGA